MLKMRAASYRYPSLSEPSAGPLDLDVAPGELVLLTGPTGCGKSTLLRLAAGLLQRHGRGEVSGAVTVGGDAPESLPPAERVARIGFVSQEPSDQIVAGTLGDEIAFGLESAGWKAHRIGPRVDELLDRMGLSPDPERAALALSGGQRQKLVIAAALAAGAKLLLLDEPLSQLDPGSARDLLGQLRRLADEGIAVLLVEHRRRAVLPFADRMVEMEDGRIVRDEPVERGAPPSSEDWRPAPRPAPPLGAPTAAILSARALSHRFGSVLALDRVDVSLHPGERVALVGRNGAGKSTLLGLLAGYLPGKVRRRGRVVDVPQDPDLALFCATVRQELAYGPVEARLAPAEVAARVAASAEALSLSDLLDRPPQALSRGQRLRAAVAAALSCRPEALLLDEPTSGQDAGQVERMMLGLRSALAEGLLVFATHDLPLARRHATRVLVLEAGRIVAEGAPGHVLAEGA